MPWNGLNPGKRSWEQWKRRSPLVAAAAMLKDFERTGRGPEIFLRPPNTLCICNPVLDNLEKGFGFDKFPARTNASRAI